MSKLSPDVIDALVEAAAAVRKRAHAPYSGYSVGAAVLDGEGRTHLGCNVENASYGLTVCAERHAVAAAVAAGATELRGVAVVTASVPPASPCGACRQVLAEFGDFPVVLANPDGNRRLTTVSELLPDAFGPGVLKPSPR
jgi:cytidine deaminase